MSNHAARNTDPNTSHVAARLNSKGRASHCQRLLRAFDAIGPDGYSDHEAAQAADLDRVGVCWWHRASDLRKRGWIEWRTTPEGNRIVRRGDHGTDVGVSVITDAGRAAML